MERGTVPIKQGGRAHVRFLDTYKWVKIASPSRNHVHLSFHYIPDIPKQANLHEIHPRSIHLPPPTSTSSNPPLPPPRKKASPLGQINIPSRLTVFSSPELWISLRSTRIDRLFLGEEGLAGISNRSIDRTWMLRRRNQLTQKLENFVSSSIRSLTFLEFPGEISAYGSEREGGFTIFFFFGKRIWIFNKCNDSKIILCEIQFAIGWWKLC